MSRQPFLTVSHKSFLKLQIYALQGIKSSHSQLSCHTFDRWPLSVPMFYFKSLHNIYIFTSNNLYLISGVWPSEETRAIYKNPLIEHFLEFHHTLNAEKWYHVLCQLMNLCFSSSLNGNLNNGWTPCPSTVLASSECLWCCRHNTHTGTQTLNINVNDATLS